MNIQFDDNISQNQAQGIILLLTSLFPSLGNSHPVSPAPSHIHIYPTTAATEPQPEQPSQSPVTAVTEPTTEAPKRTRRTKAEMEAERAITPSDPTQGSAATPAEASGTIQSAPVGNPTADAAKPISADELRGLLNNHIAKHSMEGAIAILQSFGCNRVTEALALDPIKLNELAAVLRG
jgi:hypothetical protein